LNISAVFIQTGRNIRQTWGAQLMTLLTVSLSVLIFSFFFLVFFNLQKAGVRLSDHIRLIIYFENDIAPAMRPQLEKQIRGFSDVEKVVFITRKDAFDHLTRQLGPESNVLLDINQDFLPPSIEVYPAKNLETLSRIKLFSDFLATLPGAQKVEYGREWIERLAQFTQLVRIIVFLSGALLVLTATFMVSSTVRLTLITRHAELEILRLLGASKSYIQIPLVLEGILQGLLGTGFGLICLYIFYAWVKTKFSGPALLSIFSFTFMPQYILASILLLSIVLCTLGSIVSIRKFLRI
jgi:cell division transport system permease protein